MRISDWSSDVCSSDLLLSFFYPNLRIKKTKKLFTRIKIKQMNSVLFFKFRTKTQKTLAQHLKNKKNTKLFKNFFLNNFYKKLKNTKNIINIKINQNNTLIKKRKRVV